MKSAKDKNREVRKNNKVLLTDWKECYLGDYMELISGQHLVPGEYNEEKVGIPYFTGPSDFTNEIDKIIKWTNKKTKHAIVEDVLITVKGSGVGQLHFLEIEKPVAIGRQLMAIRRKNSNARFLYYLLLFKGYQIEVLSRGNMIPGVTRDDIIKLKVLFPPVPEQQKIARILSTWDKAIEKTEQLIAQKQQLKKGLMQQLLTGKVRFKEFVKSKKMKKTKLGLIPEDWEIKFLEKVATVKGGKRLPKGENLTEENTGYPYIRVSDMFLGGVDTSNILYVPKHIEPLIKNYKITKDELFITVAGTIGLVGEIPKELDNANLTENANKISIIKSTDKKYILYTLMSDRVQNLIKGTTTNNAQPKLALERIRKFEIVYPSLLEQTKISRVLYLCDQELEFLVNQLEGIRSQKKGLMQQLLTGKIRVKLN